MKCKGKCSCCKLTASLLVLGGLNWGLVGLMTWVDVNLNVVNLLLGKWPTAEGIVYLVIGAASIMAVIGAIMCKCKKCECKKEK